MNRLFPSLVLVALLACAGCAAAERMASSAGDVAGSMAGTVSASWTTNATAHRGEIGRRYAYVCPAGGSANAIWGTAVYSDDSSVCTAGVHAGSITLAEGGRVVIEMRPGQTNYPASNRNGVSSGEWGAWDGSFAVVN
jgi:hypothetical protein